MIPIVHRSRRPLSSTENEEKEIINKYKLAAFLALNAVVLSTSLWADEVSQNADMKPARAPDIHFVPTPNEVVEIMLRLADVKKNDVVYDLGCGDGRIVIAAAKKAGCRAVGFDINPKMVEISRENVREAGVEHLVTIKEADIFTLDLSEASVITLYLLPSLNVRLIPQLKKMNPGSRIVSHDFDMEGVRPDVESVVIFGENGASRRNVYLWTTPLKKSGKLGYSESLYNSNPYTAFEKE